MAAKLRVKLRVKLASDWRGRAELQRTPDGMVAYKLYSDAT